MEYYDKYFLQNCIIAEGRRKRPLINQKALDCPFCFPHDGVVILKNAYPVADEYTDLYGIHDVVVDTPFHQVVPKDFTDLQWEVLLLKMQQRWHVLSKDDKVKFIQIFKNSGTCGGASISHSHWQILALGKVPDAMQNLYQQYASYNMGRRCYLCDYLQNPTYCILETTHWKIYSPKAPRFAYEILLIPKVHYHHYGEIPLVVLKEGAHLLKRVLVAYDLLEPHCAYNICMMSSDLEVTLDYHFHIKVVMRLGNMAGFEVATGCFINMVSPIHAVEKLRKLLKE